MHHLHTLFPPQLRDAAEAFLSEAKKKDLRLAVAESCTGGLVTALLTEVPGSADVLECGFVTYSNGSKTRLLNVPPTLVMSHGAVSAETARAMAEGALKNSNADISVAVTGLAGPTGGSEEKPVGLVHFAATTRTGGLKQRRMILPGTRTDVRLAAVKIALEMLRELVG